MKLYGNVNSGHAYKVALALTLSQIDYEYETVDISVPCSERQPAFRSASRWCEVPCLVIDGEPLTQSAAILLMLAREHAALGGMAQIDRATEWLNWEANRIGMCIPQLLGDLNDGAREWLMDRYDIDTARMSASLGDQKFLLGDNISIADIAVYGYVSKVEKANLTLQSNILQWRERIEALPHFQTADELLS